MHIVIIAIMQIVIIVIVIVFIIAIIDLSLLSHSPTYYVTKQPLAPRDIISNASDAVPVYNLDK